MTFNSHIHHRFSSNFKFLRFKSSIIFNMHRISIRHKQYTLKLLLPRFLFLFSCSCQRLRIKQLMRQKIVRSNKIRLWILLLLLELKRNSPRWNPHFISLNADSLYRIAQLNYLLLHVHHFGGFFADNRLEESLLGVQLKVRQLANL